MSTSRNWDALERMFEHALGPAGERTVTVQPVVERPHSSFSITGSILPMIGGQTKITAEVASVRADGDEVLGHIRELIGDRPAPSTSQSLALGNTSMRNGFTELAG